MANNFYVGTSGWSYVHWKEIFYPKGLPSGRYLEYYTEHFDCVELNASFYRLPTVDTVKGWVKRTPTNFRFAVKLSRLITHIKKLNNSEEALEMFFKTFKPAQKKMGPILVQLPPNLEYGRPQIEPFFKLLKTKYKKYKFALEPRHPSWSFEKCSDLLLKYNLAWVIADSGSQQLQEDNVIGDLVYIRFHGPKSLYSSNYSEKALLMYANKTAQWLKQGKQVWAFFNNDAKGYAVRNAKTFREQVTKLII